MTDTDKAILQALVRARTNEQRAVTRARIVLRPADGLAIERVAAELGVAVMTVKLWRRRYARLGVDGLADRPRPRIWAEAGLQTHRTETFKFSTDPHSGRGSGT